MAHKNIPQTKKHKGLNDQQNIPQTRKKRETTKRGPQVHGLPSWTWSMDYTRGPRTTPVDHSHGPLAKFRLPNNRPSTINPSLGRRDWRELFHYSLPLFISQSIQFLLMNSEY